MRNETQGAISDWADSTFGPVSSNARVAARANEEMAELLRALTVDDASPKAAEEIADIFIVLFRLATRLGVDVDEAIDRKMQINRLRKWNKDGSGHGYHVRDKWRDEEVAVIGRAK
jgi:NTP pyrophosphatase (non-canonical NTP hydrolase)